MNSIEKTLSPCSCGSVVFEKITEMRGHVIDSLTITPQGVKTKRMAERIRIEREPKAVTCLSCGKRTRAKKTVL